MFRALYSAGSGMTAQQTNVDNIAHNLANANTTGFKMRRAQFQDLLYQNYVQPGAASSAQTVIPSGLQIGLGTRADLQRDQSLARQLRVHGKSFGRRHRRQRILPDSPAKW